MLFCHLQKLVALCGDQLLVGGHHAFARAQQLRNEFKRRVQTAHGLHHDLYLVIVENDVEIFDKLPLVWVAGEIAQIQNIL